MHHVTSRLWKVSPYYLKSNQWYQNGCHWHIYRNVSLMKTGSVYYSASNNTAVVQIVETLRYKPAVRGFDSRWCHWTFFHWHNPANHTVVLGSTQTLTRNNSCRGKGRLSIDLTTLPRSCANCFEICEPVPSGTFWSSNRPVQWLIYFLHLEISHASFQFHITITQKSPLSLLIRNKSSFYSRWSQMGCLLWETSGLDPGAYTTPYSVTISTGLKRPFPEILHPSHVLSWLRMSGAT